MIDGSHFPYEENIRLTKQVVEYAHQYDVTVEGELGVLAGIEDEVLILGVLERIEIWNPKIYETYMNNQPATYETVAEVVLKPTP